MVIPENPLQDTKQKKKESQQVSATICSNCGTTTTPLWRRAPNGDTICNACGLYLKARNTLRPPSMKRNFKSKQEQLQESMTHNTINAADAPAGTCPGGGQCNGTGGSPSCEGCPAFNQHQVNRHALICANCRTTTTPLWRRDGEGNTICNACGLYYKLHNVHRPVSMKRSVIKRRKRVIVSENGDIREGEEEEDELESSSEGDHVDSDDEEKVKQAAEKKAKKKKRRVVKATMANLKNGSTSSNQSATAATVPSIEDYIEPKRASYPPPPPKTMPPALPPQPRLPPAPRTPPTQFHPARNLPLISDISRSLPPTNRFDPLSDYRSTASPQPPPQSTSQVINQKIINLPPIAAIGPTTTSASPPAPPPPAATAAPYPSQASNNPYNDLCEFDYAMTRLERLRRRIPPEQCHILSRLTHPLQDIVSQAENILQYTINNTIIQHHQNNTSTASNQNNNNSLQYR